MLMVCNLSCVSSLFAFILSLMIFMVSLIGILTYKSFISAVISLVFSLHFRLFKKCAIEVELFKVYVCLGCIISCSFTFMNLAILCVGAPMLFMTGLIGMLSLCSLSLAFSLGATGFFVLGI